MKNPKCPRCDSTMFDGEHCIKCGYLVVEITGKQVEKNCKRCGKEMLVWKFHGDSLIGEKGRQYVCKDCYKPWDGQEIQDRWARQNGYLKKSPEGIKQSRNFDRWCKGSL